MRTLSQLSQLKMMMRLNKSQLSWKSQETHKRRSLLHQVPRLMTRTRASKQSQRKESRAQERTSLTALQTPVVESS